MHKGMDDIEYLGRWVNGLVDGWMGWMDEQMRE